MWLPTLTECLLLRDTLLWLRIETNALHCPWGAYSLEKKLLGKTEGYTTHPNIYFCIFFFFLSCCQWCSVTQLCRTLCVSMDCSLPDFSIHGIFQARILEWAAISFSRLLSIRPLIISSFLYHKLLWPFSWIFGRHACHLTEGRLWYYLSSAHTLRPWGKRNSECHSHRWPVEKPKTYRPRLMTVLMKYGRFWNLQFLFCCFC